MDGKQMDITRKDLGPALLTCGFKGIPKTLTLSE